MFKDVHTTHFSLLKYQLSGFQRDKKAIAQVEQWCDKQDDYNNYGHDYSMILNMIQDTNWILNPIDNYYQILFNKTSLMQVIK